MRRELGECNVEACTAAINCCALGGAPERARDIFDAMPGWGLQRDKVTFGSAIKACGQHWSKARELLDCMRRELGECSVTGDWHWHIQ
eukprot:gene58221-biopygen105706